MSTRIVIENYSPEWPVRFQELKSIYEQHLGEWVIAVHHVGSTSVEGLDAKPILDIDLVIKERSHFEPVKQVLNTIGYDHLGDLGIAEREMFKRRNDSVPFTGESRQWPLHHLYVCREGITALRNHLAFRDYLRENPDKRDEYAALKKRLASAHANDIDAYVREKTEFVINGLRAKGIGEEELSAIIAANKAIGR